MSGSRKRVCEEEEAGERDVGLGMMCCEIDWKLGLSQNVGRRPGREGEHVRMLIHLRC